MKLAPGAWRYALPPLVAAPFAAIFSAGAAILAAAAGVATLAFFRDPDRTPPLTGVLAPADGTVSVLRTEGERVRLGIFMNVWNVHVVRAPVAGSVVDLEHVPGANRPAFSKDSDRNERLHVRLGGDEGSAVVTLVAGAFARRIHPYVDPGDRLERGERLGHIAFGSRVDVLFPPSVGPGELAVGPGDRTTAGETVVLDSVPTEWRADGVKSDGDEPDGDRPWS